MYLGLILLETHFSAEPSDVSLIHRIFLQQFIIDLYPFLLQFLIAAIIHVFVTIEPQ